MAFWFSTSTGSSVSLAEHRTFSLTSTLSGGPDKREDHQDVTEVSSALRIMLQLEAVKLERKPTIGSDRAAQPLLMDNLTWSGEISRGTFAPLHFRASVRAGWPVQNFSQNRT